ncbi:MAG: hypothetical protein K0M39_09160 [Rhizobium sp.]|nr:hypothetical protein [Rhizobium sp.]
MTTKTTGRAGWHQATQETTHKQDITAPAHLISMLSAIKRRIWLMGYEFEESRQLHAASGNFWKEAGACIALALLRFGRLV